MIFQCRFLFGALWKCVKFTKTTKKSPRKLRSKCLWKQKRLPVALFKGLCSKVCTCLWAPPCTTLLSFSLPKNKGNQTSYIKYSKMNRKNALPFPNSFRRHHTHIKNKDIKRDEEATLHNMFRFGTSGTLNRVTNNTVVLQTDIESPPTYGSFVSQTDIKSHHLWLVENNSRERKVSSHLTNSVCKG